ncbi:PREDICTED: uncharacterized protein LOC107336758 [Acropora digitifera]|uniref:uncharacterized protein LOC107336758 n=1 Tax=Acropora digitifera TaxID=70779 RepID=UPI00077ADD25|nr:PREDICTED: uncharacterized protein LOC107336758 [Acropora digitifera]
MERAEKTKGSSLLTAKERNCAVRNTILRSTNEKISVSMQNEQNQLTKSLNFEAKKLREKLTLLTPRANTNSNLDAASSTTKEPSFETSKLKLPVIKNESRSAPCSPLLDNRKSITNFSSNISDNVNSSQSQAKRTEAWPRRISTNDAVDLQRSSPLVLRKSDRLTSYRQERLGPPSLPYTEENNNVKISPLMPRNLKLRQLARWESLFKEFLVEGETPDMGPTLEDQFKSLGTCRYLRQGTKDDLKESAEATEEADDYKSSCQLYKRFQSPSMSVLK